MKKIKENILYVFDFDKTLYKTPEKEEGILIYKEKTGTDWTPSGWWGRKETLDINIFDITLNEFTYGHYKDATDMGAHRILLTGRHNGLRKEVLKILERDNIFMDDYHLNNISDTFKFKTRVVKEYLNMNPHINKMVFLDDRFDHKELFEMFFEKFDVDIKFIFIE